MASNEQEKGNGVPDNHNGDGSLKMEVKTEILTTALWENVSRRKSRMNRHCSPVLR
jgi:hypothetical protein